MALRESLVAPSVEDNLLKLNELVKNMGNKGNDLTESQTRRMVAYLGNMDEMRHQLVVMIQRYEDDERVLRRLLDLVDRIDEMKMIVDHHNAASFEPDGADIVDNIDEELAKQLFDQPFNPLMVSAKEVSILAVSGLADDGAYAASLAYQDEEADDEGNPWDQVDDPDQLQASIEFEDPNLEVEALQIQLSASSISLPSIIPLRDSLQLPPPPPPPMPAKAFKPRLQQTSSSSSGSGSSSSVRRGPRRAHSELTLSLSSDESDTGSSSEGETAARRWNRGMRPNARQPIVQPPPPPPPAPASKGKRRVYGACAAVACKICYEEYTKHEDIFEFDECHHVYCRVCLTQYFEHHIGEGAVLDLCCPSPNCTTEVTIEDIRFLCDYDTVGKYERFVVIASLKADANTRWCPGPGCVNGVKYDNQQWLHCNLCNLDFCSMCLLNKHEGSECSKAALAALAARQAEEEKALEQFKKWAESQNSRIKPCPRCHSFIEKTEGCNHMTCANISCRHQFCWLCLGDYDDGRHFNDFTNYPNCYDKQFFYTNNYDVPDFAHNPIARRRFGRIAKKIGIYVGVGMAVVTLGVPAAVIGGPVYGCFQLHKRLKAKRAAKARRDTYYNPDFVPPSPERIAAARREVERLRALEQGLNLGRY